MTGPTAYTVRRPTRADAPAFAALHAEVWRVTYRGLMEDEVVDGLTAERFRPMWESVGAAYDEDRVAGDGREMWVVTAGEEPVAFVMWGPARDEDAPAKRQLWALNVAPAHQGVGLAQHLLDDVFGPGAAYLWVARGNRRAIRFYERNGFVLDGTVSDRPDGMVEHRMVRPG